MVNQTTRVFGTTIEIKALIKILVTKNKGYLTQANEAKEVAKKSKFEVEALKKSQAEEWMKLISALEEIENLKKRSTYPKVRWPL